MPRPRRARAPRTSAIAFPIVGWLAPKPVVNWENNVDPIPAMTARNLTPDEMIVEHPFGCQGGPAKQSKGDENEDGQCRQLEFDQRDEKLDRENEEGKQHKDGSSRKVAMAGPGQCKACTLHAAQLPNEMNRLPHCPHAGSIRAIIAFTCGRVEG